MQHDAMQIETYVKIPIFFLYAMIATSNNNFVFTNTSLIILKILFPLLTLDNVNKYLSLSCKYL